MIAATAGTACSPWVRVAKRDEAFVKPALDFGAEGIMFPLVRTAEEAAECASLDRSAVRLLPKWHKADVSRSIEKGGGS